MITVEKRTQEEIRIQAEKKALCASCRESIEKEVSKIRECPVFDGRTCPLYDKRTFTNFKWDYVSLLNHRGGQLYRNEILLFSTSLHSRIILLGNVGVGKTHLAEAVFLDYRKGRESEPDITNLPSGDRRDKINEIARMAGAQDLYDLFLKAQNFSEIQYGSIEGLRYITKSELLVIDDLGSEKQTEKEVFNQGFLDLLDKHRGKVVATSNLCLSDIEERYGKKIFSRLMERCIIAIIKGEDYRKRGLK